MSLQRDKRARRRRYKIRSVNSSNLLRLTVFRSINNIYAQIIDDSKGQTLLSVSSLNENLREKIKGMSKISVANEVGKEIGICALNSGISQVIFDCGGYKYHGRVSAVAEGARSSGLMI